MNVAFFDDKPKAFYLRRQRNLARALETGFILVGMDQQAPRATFRFLWQPDSPITKFDHEAFGRACSELHSILSDGLECRFLKVDDTAKNIMRDGVCVHVGISPSALEW